MRMREREEGGRGRGRGTGEKGRQDPKMKGGWEGDLVREPGILILEFCSNYRLTIGANEGC